jgi:hypothetical protein
MILGDWIHAIALAMGTTDANAGLVVSMVFILTLVIITLASKIGEKIQALFIVTFCGIILFTGIGWIDVIYGIALAFFVALMGAVMISKIFRTGGAD